MSRAVPVQPAATVMLIRDGQDGLEVCLLQRNLKSAWIGGLHIFPGGSVDPADGAPAVESICAGLTDAEASRRLQLAEGGLAFWVAAVRETFEEAGLLLARTADGDPLRLDDDEVVARFADHRRAVDEGARRLVDICAEEDLRLAVGEMHYVAHWITPPGEARRYDTRFFLAAAPEGQQPIHDDREVISAEWIRPADALAQLEAGTFFMMPPTVVCLRSIAGAGDVREALAAAAALGEVETVAPRLLKDDDGQVTVVRPGEPGYDDAYIGDEVVRGTIT